MQIKLRLLFTYLQSADTGKWLISAWQEPAPSLGVGQELHRSCLWEKEYKSGKALLALLPSSEVTLP